MRGRHGLVGIGVVVALAVATRALAGGASGSVVAHLHVSDARVEIQGAGCGVPASATMTLPAGASNVQVRKPVVGARNEDARLTGVSIQGNVVTFIAVGDGTVVCGGAPNEPWFLDFDTDHRDLDVAFTGQVTVLFFDDVFGGLHLRPRTVPLISIKGFSARHVRWKRFGGSKAIGFGIMLGGRVEVLMRTPSYCPGLTLQGHLEDAVLYRKVVFIGLGGRRQGLGRASKVPKCPFTGKQPTLLP
jgi:hypothetical protein